MNKIIVVFLVLVILAVASGGIVFFLKSKKEEPVLIETTDTQTVSESDIQAVFSCAEGKMIFASFSDRQVALTLSDQRAYTLPQTISASGARYADEEEKIVFWNKGNTAFIQEDGVTTFEDCVTEDVPTNGVALYGSDTYGISFAYPTFYYLRESEAGTAERPQGSIVLVEDTEENRNLLDGVSTEPREGPTSITIDIYENPDQLSALAWVERDTNWTISNRATTTVAVGGFEGISFVWDGLYAGKTVIVAADGKAYVFSVTWMTDQDRIISDFSALLETVGFSAPVPVM